MNKYDFFWKTMGLCDWNKAGDDMMVLEPVIDYLSRQSDRKIHKFHNQMNELLYALDTKALAEQCQRAYEQANDDTFLYSRCVALINGPEYYAKAKAGLETGMWTMEFEALLYIPCTAWARKHGREAESYSYTPRNSSETGSNQKGWA